MWQKQIVVLPTRDDRKVFANGKRSGGGSTVEVEQSAEAFGFVKDPFAATRWLVRERDDILSTGCQQSIRSPTGQTLFALHEAGGLLKTDPAYQRGV
jgi:hypothetical protein